MKYLALLFLLFAGPLFAGTLNISEYHGIAMVDRVQPSSLVGGHTGTAFDITTSASSTQSQAFATTTKIIRVVSNTSVRIQIGDNPTATATSTWLPSGVIEYFAVLPGHRLAVIDD